jgi:hypothetical protein
MSRDSRLSLWSVYLRAEKVSSAEGAAQRTSSAPGTPLIRCLYVFFLFLSPFPSSSAPSKPGPPGVGASIVPSPMLGSRSFPFPLLGDGIGELGIVCSAGPERSDNGGATGTACGRTCLSYVLRRPRRVIRSWVALICVDGCGGTIRSTCTASAPWLDNCGSRTDIARGAGTAQAETMGRR